MPDYTFPESPETLRRQQAALIAGRRAVQMFPNGTPELPLPENMARHTNPKGVFHFNPLRIHAGEIDRLCARGEENIILKLGPYAKWEIVDTWIFYRGRVRCVVERAPDGVELRCAVGVTATLDEQKEYFERTKEPGSTITEETHEQVILQRWKATEQV